MNDIQYIKAYQENGQWRVSPMPDVTPPSHQSPIGDMGHRTNGSLSRWGEQLEHNLNLSFSTYVKPLTARIIVMSIEDMVVGRFLFRTRTKYPKLRLFRFVYRLLKSESLECVPFACEACSVGVIPVGNGWFQLSLHSNIEPARTNYIVTHAVCDKASW